MDNAGQRISFDALAREAKVSRSWLYNQPDLRAEIERLRERRNPSPAVRPVPDRQRASEASLRRRLEVATQRNSQLEAENKQLRAALAIALGEQRAAAVIGSTRHAEKQISSHDRAMLTVASSTLTATHPHRSATRAQDRAEDNARKRHIAVDTGGLLLAVVVTAACIQDRDAAHRLLAVLRARFATVSLVFADGGYAGRLVTWAKSVLALGIQIVKRSDATTGFEVLPRRWVVERTFGWLVKHRRCVRDYETRTDHHEAMVYIASIHTLTCRLARIADQDT
jgi:transposase